MTEKSETLNPHLSAKQLTITFSLFLVIHLIVVYLANSFFPKNIVLGNHFFSPTMGLFYTVFPFTVLTVGMLPIITAVAEHLKRTVSNMEWMIDYLLINVGLIWLLTRFAEWLGMGISSWIVAVLLGAVITFLQGMVMPLIIKKSVK